MPRTNRVAREVPRRVVVDEAVLRQYVEFGQERRGVEFKASMPWTGHEGKLTKAIIAMANQRDGGVVIIGRPEPPATPGISDDDDATYDIDQIQPSVNRYANPYVELTLVRFRHGAVRYLAIVVNEFRDLPVICQRGTPDGVLGGAKIYVRSLRAIETTEIQTPEDLRELINLAVDKGIQRFATQAARAGIEVGPSTAADTQAFSNQKAEAFNL